MSEIRIGNVVVCVKCHIVLSSGVSGHPYENEIRLGHVAIC